MLLNLKYEIRSTNQISNVASVHKKSFPVAPGSKKSFPVASGSKKSFPVASGFSRTKSLPAVASDFSRTNHNYLVHLKMDATKNNKFPVASDHEKSFFVASDFSRTKYKTYGKSRSPRLCEFNYTRILYPVHIIIGTYKKKPIFLRNKYAEILIEEIKKFEDPIVAWCLMPDHLHLLFNPDGRETNLLEIIKSIKGKSSRKVNQTFGVQKLWQKSFYDHILRKEESIEQVALYILNNPVRKGIANEWYEYKYSWSKYYGK